jgi:IS1 family transposase
VVWERTPAVLQGVIDRAPHAERCFSDAALVYRELSYWGTHTSMYNKSETYSVEAVNADLRHYLARLGRRSRCFSRCIHALRRAVDLSSAATTHGNYVNASTHATLRPSLL